MAVTPPPVYKYDTLITGGHVIDPANGVDGPADVAILDGRIAGCLQPDARGGEFISTYSTSLPVCFEYGESLMEYTGAHKNDFVAHG
jgi:hypothetical protein